MIIIDKLISEQRLLITISENQTDIDSALHLILESPFSNQTYTITLPANTSSFKSRYDEFILNTSIFNNYKEGQYYYKVIQVTDNKVLESGLLEIKGNAQSVEYVTLESNETDDDVIVYQSN